MKERWFGLQKNIFVLGLTSLFNDLSSEMIVSVFPAFFTSVLKAGAASLGLVEGLAEGASNFIKIYSGHLSDKIQRRKVFVMLGYALSVLTRPFYMFTAHVPSVLGLRFTDWIGKGLRDAPRDAIISLSSPQEEMGRSFGYHRAMDTIGAVLGPLVAYLILRRFPGGFTAVFTTAFFVGLIAVASLLLVSEITGVAQARKLTLGSLRRFSAKFKQYLLSVFILSIGSLPVAVLLLKTQDIGLMIASVPLFYMLYNLSYALFSMSAGKASDALGAKKVLIVGYLILLASYLLLGYARSAVAMSIAFLVLGLFPALTDGVQRAYAAELTAEAERGSTYGLLNAASGLGAILAGLVGGYIWQVFGDAWALGFGGVMVIIGLLPLLRL